ncbi:MAG: hypothetical protein MUD14_28225 [Hydrococcus sp. Prado102]|jgi:hypothetical protein|nr:hypothetical protein [Hydrococcus sp. Prado102]
MILVSDAIALLFENPFGEPGSSKSDRINDGIIAVRAECDRYEFWQLTFRSRVKL